MGRILTAVCIFVRISCTQPHSTSSKQEKTGRPVAQQIRRQNIKWLRLCALAA